MADYGSNRLHDILRVKTTAASLQFNFDSMTKPPLQPPQGKESKVQPTFWSNVRGGGSINERKGSAGMQRANAMPIISQKGYSSTASQRPPNVPPTIPKLHETNKSAWSTNNERCRSAAVSKRPGSNIRSRANFDGSSQASSMMDENSNYTNNQYNTGAQMSTGSRLIMEQKQEKDQRSQQQKEELFKKYGGKQELSVLDIYIQNQGKNSYVTPGIQKFESNLINSLQRIQSKQSSAPTNEMKLAFEARQLYQDHSRSNISASQSEIPNLKGGKPQYEVPKNLLKKQSNGGVEVQIKIDKEQLNYAKAKWLQKRGVNVLSIDKTSEEESKKLFRYIDYDNTGLIQKQQIRLFLAFVEGEFGKANAKILETNPVFKQLNTLLNQGHTNIDEAAFSQLMSKATQKPKTAIAVSRANHKPGLLDLRETTDNAKQVQEKEELSMIQDSFNRVKGLKDNLEGLIQKLQKNITEDLGSDAEEDSPLKRLDIIVQSTQRT
ncbi:hypothetical protein FGO68_gene4266 [Halteria grandinella]|uniref:EF-hand domain-containing protein n=1 Tax=Halteria grandinella TaxID=5974 RepID=A0A8J8P5H1_HALGN|nr:hypothetical protein FGO68_gene4266 [Halteria grandinella]